MGLSSKKFTRGLRRNFAKAQRAVAKFGKSLKRNLGRIATRTIQAGLIAVGAGLAIATREFVRFDQTIVGATARFKDLEIGTEKTALVMDELKNKAREVGAITQFTATEAAAGLNFFAKAGFTSAEAIGALKTQVDLATVAELDLARTSDITSDLLGALGLNAADSATKIDNLAKLSNSLGLAANMANVTLEDIFETLKIAGPIATAAGEDMNTLISLTAALGSAGIKGSMGATAIKNAYLNLATNAPKVQKALEGIGLVQSDFVDQRTGTLDMVKAMKLIGDASKDMGNVKQLALFEQIFGKRAVAGAVNISKNLSEIDQIIRALESDKNIADIADQIRTGLGMQVKILRSGLLELGFKFVEAFEKQGRGALSNLITAVQSFDMTSVINGARFLGEVFKKLISFIKPVIDTIIRIGTEIFTIFKETETGAKVLEFLGSLFGALGVAIEVMWKIAKPILKLLLQILDPILTVITAILDAIASLAKFKLAGGSVAKLGQTGLQMAAERRSPEEEARRTAAGESFRGRLGQAPISPSERSALVREESVSRGEVTIKDETGRAEMTQPIRGGGFNLNLVNSGGF